MAEGTGPAAATPLVYLDVDDEITSAAARIRASTGERVALVLPYGSRLATSRMNFRLLAREASQRGIALDIVTADASARALAMAAGLAVHASVAAYEGRLSGAATGSTNGSGPGAENGHDGAIAGAVSVGLTPAVPAGPPIDDDTATRVITIPRTTAARVPRVGPARPPVQPRTLIAVGVGALAVIVLGGWLALNFLPTATITLAPRSETIGPLALTIEARPDVTTPDAGNLAIPAQRLRFALQASDTFEATGVKVTDTKATGNVTFSSFDTSATKTVAAGAIVKTEAGIEFVTLANVTLPPATYVFVAEPSPHFEFVPTTSTVSIEAVEVGEVGNVGNNTITVVPKGENKKLLKVTNKEATSGGGHTESPQVSQADVDAALAALDDALRSDLAQQVADRAGVPPGVTLFAQTAVLGEITPSVDPATLVGQASAQFELGATAEGTALGVDPAPLAEVARLRLEDQVPAGWTLASETIATSLGTPSVIGETISYPISVRATRVHDVDGDALLGQVRGKPMADARAILDDYGDVEITLWPDWVTAIPNNLDRITFTLGEPRPAPTP